MGREKKKNCGKHRGRIILASNKLTLQETFPRLEISTQRSSERTSEVHFFTLALVSDAESEKWFSGQWLRQHSGRGHVLWPQGRRFELWTQLWKMKRIDKWQWVSSSVRCNLVLNFFLFSKLQFLIGVFPTSYQGSVFTFFNIFCQKKESLRGRFQLKLRQENGAARNCRDDN